MKKELKENLDNLKAEAAKEGTEDITMLKIIVEDTGGLDVWVFATGDSYGSWRFGEPGQEVTDFEITPAGLLEMDTDEIVAHYAQQIEAFLDQFN